MGVLLERRDAVAVITLDRPEAGNALDEPMIDALADAAAAVRADREVRGVLLRATGRNFCVGGDVKAFAARMGDLPAHLRSIATTFHRAIVDIRSIDAPVVAAVQGSAAGGGLSVACLGDLLVAGRSARFVVAYTGIGLSPDGGSSWALPRLIGSRLALDLFLTNRALDADAALAAGLVSRVVDDEAVDDEAFALVRTLAAGPTAAYAAGKRLLAASLANPLDVQLDLERDSIAERGGSADGQEGIRAFIEKRPPRFVGH